MDDKKLVKICKVLLKKKDKKKKAKKKTAVKRIPFEDPATRGAFPIAGRAGFGTYGQPFGYAPPSGGTTIVARDQPLEVIKKPDVKFVGELESKALQLNKKTDAELKAEGALEFLKALQAQQNITTKESSDSIFIKKPKVKQPDMDTDDDSLLVIPEFIEEYEDIPDFTKQEQINRFFRKPSVVVDEPTGGGLKKFDPFAEDQPTEILKPQLDFSLIREKARERKERSQMGDEDVFIPRDVRDIPSRLREVAERSRMGREDVNVNPDFFF